MRFDPLTVRSSLKSLEGLNEWSLNDRDFLIQLVLELLDGLEELSEGLNHREGV